MVTGGCGVSVVIFSITLTVVEVGGGFTVSVVGSASTLVGEVVSGWGGGGVSVVVVCGGGVSVVASVVSEVKGQ